MAKRLLRLIEETQRDPFGGTGKAQPLKGDLADWWSKRIDQEYRLIYRVTLERKMNLHEETERTENEAIALISLLTHEVSGP